MSKLSEEQVTIRKAQAIQVLTAMSTQNISQADACNIAGISPKVYRRWIAEDDDALDIIKNLVNVVQAEELAMITVVKGQILSQLLQRATGGAMEDKDLLATIKLLDEKSDKVAAIIGADTPEDDALKYLDGPQTRDIKQRAGERGNAKVNIKAKTDGSVDVELPIPEDTIEEGEFEELPGEIETGAGLTSAL